MDEPIALGAGEGNPVKADRPELSLLEITGIERDQAVARTARLAAPDARVVEGDVNRLPELVGGPFDTAVCLWASFGYGTPAESAGLLEAMGNLLELVAVGRAAGLSAVLVCSEFDEATPAEAEHARMQLVFERGRPS
jgi:hypothetical protein